MSKAPRRKKDRDQAPPKRKKSFALKLAVGGFLVVVTLWMSLYSAQVGKGPWGWSDEDWNGFLTFSMEQVEEAKQQAKKTLKKVKEWDYDKLWNNLGDLEKRLDEKLAKLQGGSSVASPQTGATTETPSSSSPTTSEPANGSSEGPATEPAAAAPKSELQLGCEAMQKAVGHFRNAGDYGTSNRKRDFHPTKDSQKELKKAKKLFTKAQIHLEAANSQAKGAGDSALQYEIEGLLVECNAYLHDCSKRMVIE